MSEDTSIADNTVEKLVKAKVKEFMMEMENLGFNKSETLQYLKERYGENNE